LFGLGAVAYWLLAGPTVLLLERVPGLDRPAGPAAVAERPLEGKLTTFSGTPGALEKLSAAWPCFRGPAGDNIVHDTPKLARQWPKTGPKRLWSLDLGEGYAGAAVWAGRVFVLDYDRNGSADALRCFALADGKEIWRYSYPVTVKRNHGMSRTIPAVTERYVATIGPKLQIGCLDPVSGKEYWLADLKQQFHATVPQWYAGQCPLVENDRFIVAPGGDALVAALDCKTGAVVWKSGNPLGWLMTHSSITPMEFGGRRMYVYCGSGGVAGVDAADGQILWETTDWKITIATIPAPLVLPGGRIFLCGGYNSGSLILQLKQDGARIVPQTIKRLKPAQFGSTQHTPILYNGHLYAVREKDKELVCLDLEGKVVWSSGSEHRFGLGPYLIADGLIYILDDDGKLTLAEAVPTGYKQLAQAQVLDGPDAWAPMAMVAGRLILRDMVRMVCIDVAQP
jgi:outer membrane protein assembly factor BamB